MVRAAAPGGKRDGGMIASLEALALVALLTASAIVALTLCAMAGAV